MFTFLSGPQSITERNPGELILVKILRLLPFIPVSRDLIHQLQSKYGISDLGRQNRLGAKVTFPLPF